MIRPARRAPLLGFVAQVAFGSVALGSVALGSGVLDLGPAHAQDPTAAPPAPEAQQQVGPPPGGGRYTLFISPVGKPYRGAMTDPYPVAAWFAAVDTDHDGHVTRAEFLADAKAFFNELDRDHDGVIEPEEVAFYEKVMAPEILAGFRPGSDDGPSIQDTGRRGYNGLNGDLSDVPVRDGNELSDSNPGRGHEQPQGAAWFSFMGEPEPVSAADGNFDGKITLKEFLKAADERFAVLDPNSRGYFVLADLPQTPVEAKAGPRKTKKKR